MKKNLILKHKVGEKIVNLPIPGLECSHMEVKNGWVYYFGKRVRKEIMNKVVEKWVDIIYKWHKDEPYPPIRPLAKKIVKQISLTEKEVLGELKILINPNIGELLPVVDKTHKWIEVHEKMGAEIIFDKLHDDYGNESLRPVKAIYDSPLIKLNSLKGNNGN